MKTLLKVVGILIGLVVLAVVGFIGFTEYRISSMPDAEDITITATPAQLARGEYLANNVMGCLDCHSQRDWSMYAGPVKMSTRGAGGEEFNEDMGLPGTFYSPNLTSAHLGDWTDGEIVRAVTMGVSKDGRPLFPLMPYHSYGKLDREDIYAVVAYLRTLPAVENDVPPSQPIFPMNIIMNLIPQEPLYSKRPARSEGSAYGEYMATASGCADCHTPFDGGQPDEAMRFAGGREFAMPQLGVVRAPNLTPHKTNGLGNWTKEMFVRRFKIYADSTYRLPAVKPGDKQTIMPWLVYAHMTDDDLGAIYDYLMTLEPIDHAIEVFTPPAG